jgi:lipopolysaccharide transport system permease protein
LPAHEQVPIIENLPTGLVSYGIPMRGLDPDGWLAETSAFALTQPIAPANLLVQGKVPVVEQREFTTELRVLIDGEEAARTWLGTGWFSVRVPVVGGPARRQVELRFSAVQQLPTPDIRFVGACVQRLGFEAAPAAVAPVIPAPEATVVATPVAEAAYAAPTFLPAPAPAAFTDEVMPATIIETSPPAAPDPPPAPGQPVPRSGDGPALAERTTARTEVAPALPPPPERIFASETVIGPSAAPLHTQVRELWRYRHLFKALVWRNVRVEFDATRLGSIWAIARPILFAVVFGFFRNLSGANTYVEIPYVLYIFSGLLLWTYFTDVATNTASAIRSDLALLTKVYYPRILTPLVPAVSNLITLLIGLVPLAGMMLWMGLRPSWLLLLLPVVVLPCIVLALGIGLVVSALSVEDRDWERVLAYSLTIGLWLSPVIYAPEMIPHGARVFYHLNPMAGPLLAFRAVLFDGVPFPVWAWCYSAVSSCVVLAVGLRVFRQTEVRLVDRL